MTVAEICESIRSGANDRVKQALTESPGLANAKVEQGVSLLTYACYCRNTEAVNLIKQKKGGLDVFESACVGDLSSLRLHLDRQPETLNVHSADGFSLLGYTCFFGHSALAQFLVERGANVNQASNNAFKVAPLHSSCAVSDYATTDMLLRYGANPNVQQQAGYTPLHEAAQNGKTELAKLLIDHGADVNALTESGQTPVALADEKGHAETAAMLRQRGGR